MLAETRCGRPRPERDARADSDPRAQPSEQTRPAAPVQVTRPHGPQHRRSRPVRAESRRPRSRSTRAPDSPHPTAAALTATVSPPSSTVETMQRRTSSSKAALAHDSGRLARPRATVRRRRAAPRRCAASMEPPPLPRAPFSTSRPPVHLATSPFFDYKSVIKNQRLRHGRPVTARVGAH
jgi:hypothetical protein